MSNKKRKRKNKVFFIALIFIVIIFALVGHFRNNKSLAANENIAALEKNYINGDTKVEENINILNKMAKDDSRIKKVLSNVNDYPKDVIKLMAHNPEAIDFAIDYPKNINKDKKVKISNYKKGDIPLFIQWDKQWGYSKYGNNIIGINGCGPTCLSMVTVGLTGDTSMNPRKVAEYSFEKGYNQAGVGTSWALMTEGAKGLGLNSKGISLDRDIFIKELKKNHPIILSVKPGDFTKEGHFIVLRGITKDGKILVNDPNSNENSAKKWDIDRLLRQGKGAWAFSYS